MTSPLKPDMFESPIKLKDLYKEITNEIPLIFIIVT